MAIGTNGYIKVYDKEILSAIKECLYCGDTEYLSVDHIIPLVSGGTSDIDNLTIACGSCNSMKGQFDLSFFLKRIIFKREEILNKVYSYTYKVKKLPKSEKWHIDWYLTKIREFRKLHSRFTRIIKSISSEKYKINGEKVC